MHPDVKAILDQIPEPELGFSPECLMEQIPEPEPGFSPAALRSVFNPDEEVQAICQGCPEQGDCVYDGTDAARTRCRVVIREVQP